MKKSIWDIFAPIYERAMKSQKNIYDFLYKEISAAVSGKSVLELATGPGMIAKNIANSAKSVVATDFAPKMIETAKKIIALSPKTVRIYPTVVLKNTYLAELYEREIYVPQNVDDAAELCVTLLSLFEQAGIKVIRLGLHASQDIKKNMVAGAYHEAFGEIVESRKMLDKILKYPPDDYEIFVNPKSVSKLKGNQKRNIYFLIEKGYNIKVTQNDKVAVDEIKIIKTR